MNAVALDVDQAVFKSGESRRITASVVAIASDGTLSKVAATSVVYFLYRQGAASSGLTLIASGVAMTDVSGGGGTDWEATITFSSANAHVVVAVAIVSGVAATSGGVPFVPPKSYFDPTELFA